MSEQESYAANYETGFRSTIRLLLSRGLLIEDAEELAQAAWVRGWEAMHQLRSSGRVIPWINTIALNSMYNQQRRRRRHVARLDEDFSVPSGPAPVAAKVDASRLLDHCTALDKSLMLHRYEGGYEMDEIAKIHGISCTATRVRIHRAKAVMRRHALKSKKKSTMAA